MSVRDNSNRISNLRSVMDHMGLPLWVRKSVTLAPVATAVNPKANAPASATIPSTNRVQAEVPKQNPPAEPLPKPAARDSEVPASVEPERVSQAFVVPAAKDLALLDWLPLQSIEYAQRAQASADNGQSAEQQHEVLVLSSTCLPIVGAPNAGLSPAFNAAAATLLNKMLAAIDLNMTSCNIAAITALPNGGVEQIPLDDWLKTSRSKVILYLVPASDPHSSEIKLPKPIVLAGGTPVIVAHHPDELLVDPSLKRAAWESLKQLRLLVPASA